VVVVQAWWVQLREDEIRLMRQLAALEQRLVIPVG
jgi:hypothetical protein